jgi:hypothetical protein
LQLPICFLYFLLFFLAKWFLLYWLKLICLNLWEVPQKDILVFTTTSVLCKHHD